MNKKLVRSIGAVLAGMAIGIALTLLTDALLEAVGIFPTVQTQLATHGMSTGQFTFAIIYRCIYTGLGGYFVARWAPDRPMRHVVIMSVIALIANFLGFLGNLDGRLGPEWYPLVLTLLAFPSGYYGGKLKR